MRSIRDYQFVRPEDRGASAAIGNFDGLHLGHAHVIGIAREAARDAPLGVVTFEPHPREFFAPTAPPFRLMNAEAKAHRLAKMGVDRLYQLAFNSSLSSLNADQFAKDVIADGLGLTHVVVGADFCFGKGRQGNTEMLQEFGEEFGFGVTIADIIESEHGQVSSTNIRLALSEGRPSDAAKMLGHWHRIDGVVISGEQRGRVLGYPTANLSIEGLHPPKFGVYAVLVDILTGPHQGSFQGAASIGVRPMFDGEVANCETYIFDFEGDIYGADISVALVEYLRGEERFDDLDGLIAQMQNDCDRSRELLGSL